MDKEKRIKSLLQTCEMALKRWDELSEDEQRFFWGKMMEANLLSHERNEEVVRGTEDLKQTFDNQFMSMKAEMGVYEAFLKERGLEDEFGDFCDSITSVAVRQLGKPQLKRVK